MLGALFNYGVLLKEQRGFMDEIALVSCGKSDRVLPSSFWNKREDAEEYQREQYQKIHDTGAAPPRDRTRGSHL
jgi:hypothetical protein